MYTDFCASYGKEPLPASEQLLILFVAELSLRVCHSTARTYLAAVRHMHISQGHGDPLKGCPRLELVLKGLKRQRPRAQDSRLPITPWILLQIKRVLARDPSRWDNVLIWAACCLGFFAFLRSGEFTVQSMQQFDASWHLTPRDISVDSIENPSILKIHLKGSKMDQTKIGLDIYIGRTQNEICPVAAILAYLALRGQDDGPLFRLSDGRPLSRQLLVEKVRSALQEANVDCARYSGHSFRIGAATTAIARGISESTVQTLGRWASDSFKRYVRIPREDLAQVSRQLAADLDK